MRKLYSGDITNWKQLPGGPDLPVRLVSRDGKSGTRGVFEKRVLGSTAEPARTSDDCKTPKFGNAHVIRCEFDKTEEVLKTVARIPGAIGYTELKAAKDRADQQKDIRLLRLDGKKPSIDDVRKEAYPFWEPEYAYTYGAPPTNSLTSKFLDFLASDTGRNLIERHGHLPCSAPENQQACRRALGG
ncbi:substrate-binding domain-containing protein [Streptomyces sp. NPDC020845]|uniref:substrate-binding domain-containing protein n=1 Tax=Streptomyces sp. NPDC020845 TaxID=3365096 RepID=UPI0037B36EE8